MIPIAKPTVTELEIETVVDAMKTSYISSGPYNEKLESLFEDFFQGRKSLLVNNGTSALHLALMAFELSRGDEVIIPNSTFIAVPNSVSYCGAKQILCDVDKDNWCIDLDKLERMIGPKTKAVIVVNSYGLSVDWDRLFAIRKKHNFYIVEDAAESLFGTYDGRQFGTFGDISTFSFYGNKLLTAGEGGCLVTENELIYEKMKMLRSQGMSTSKRFYFPMIGNNFRMNHLSAAFLWAQWHRRDEILNKLRKLESVYLENLASIIEKGFITIPSAMKTIRSPWYFSFLVDSQFDVQDLMHFLASNGIETRPIFPPISDMPPYFDPIGPDRYPTSYQLNKLGVSLPLFYDLPVAQIHRISSLVYGWITSNLIGT